MCFSFCPTHISSGLTSGSGGEAHAFFIRHSDANRIEVRESNMLLRARQHCFLIGIIKLIKSFTIWLVVIVT
jgi:hypothetical protein